MQVNDGNAPAALPQPISADLEEPALLPGAAQGLGGRGPMPPMDPAPPSNLTPSLAQGGQPYSAAQQVRVAFQAFYYPWDHSAEHSM